MTLFRRLSLATTITTICVIGVGGLVRATGSGDGCPAWPKCFGRWIPPLEYHAIIEYSHRAIGAVAIAMLCLTAIVAVRNHRAQRALLVPSLIGAFMIFVQAGLGAVVVAVKTNPTLIRFEPTLVTLHIATAMVLVGLLVYVTVTSFCLARSARAIIPRSVARWAFAAAASVYALILIGAYVRGEHAGLAFADWPLMNGALVPHLSGLALAHFLHRAAVLVVGVVLAVFVVRARRSQDAAVKAFATIAGALYLVQAVIGGAQVWTKLAAPPVVAHVVLSALIWAALIAAATVARRVSAEPVGSEAVGSERARRSVRESARAYLMLTKPRIVVLLVVTTVPTMMLAARGVPSAWLMFSTVFGGSLAAGSANAINCYFDRDIDAVMARTKRRPLPSHQVDPTRALGFALLLAAASFWFMTAAVNLLAASLAQSAILFYVFVYTLALKRTTPQNIVIGGAAGAVPVLVGWAAVTGSLGVEAYVLFCIIFFWTPPHFWALAMRYTKDYAAAGVPMLPVVVGERETARQIAFYSVILVAVTLALWPVAEMGAIYIAAASALGLWFIRHAVVLVRTSTPKAAMALFRYSIVYLALLFVSIGVDAAVTGRA